MDRRDFGGGEPVRAADSKIVPLSGWKVIARRRPRAQPWLKSMPPRWARQSIKAEAKHDAKHGVLSAEEIAGRRPTAAVIERVKVVQQYAEAAAGFFYALATRFAAAARKIEQLEIAPRTVEANALREQITPEALHSRELPPWTVILVILITTCFELPLNLPAFEWIKLGGRGLDWIAAGCATAFMVFAAHEVGRVLRTAGDQPHKRTIAAVLFLALVSAAVLVNISRARAFRFAERAHEERAAILQPASSGTGDPATTPGQRTSESAELTLLALSLFALTGTAVVSYFGCPNDHRVIQYERLCKKIAKAKREQIELMGESEDNQATGQAIERVAGHHLDMLRASYFKTLTRELAKRERRAAFGRRARSLLP